MGKLYFSDFAIANKSIEVFKLAKNPKIESYLKLLKTVEKELIFMKYPKTFIFMQKFHLSGLSVSKILLISLMIWNLTLQTSPALPPISLEPRMMTEKILPNQLTAPPQILQLVKKDLSQREKIATKNIKVLTSQPMTWPNGCLGLAKTDELCTQMLVQGWQITLGNSKQTWIYRTDSQGKAIRLEEIK